MVVELPDPVLLVVELPSHVPVLLVVVELPDHVLLVVELLDCVHLV